MLVQNLSLIFLILFSILSAFDGLYLHLYKYKLHQREDSLYEHKLHTLRALFFFIILILMFLYESKGFYLYFLILILGADYIIEINDMLIEYKSRANIGGLKKHEYFLHGQLILTRTISFSIWLTQMKVEYFNWLETNIALRNLGIFHSHIVNMAAMTFVIFALHLWLIARPNSLDFNFTKA